MPLDARDYINKLATKPKQDYKKLFGYKYELGPKTPVSGISPQGIALLDRLLSFDHRTRPSAEQALGTHLSFLSLSLHLNFSSVRLADPYFESLHDPMEEPSAKPLVDEHQDATYSIQTWKCKKRQRQRKVNSFYSKAKIFFGKKSFEQQTKDKEILFFESFSSDSISILLDTNGSNNSIK